MHVTSVHYNKICNVYKENIDETSFLSLVYLFLGDEKKIYLAMKQLTSDMETKTNTNVIDLFTNISREQHMFLIGTKSSHFCTNSINHQIQSFFLLHPMLHVTNKISALRQ